MAVVCCADIGFEALHKLLIAYGLDIEHIEDGEKIPGSWFGEPEAGLIKNTLYLRNDTPVHSALHEACHYICMPQNRRQQLDTNAGGDYAEENGVCYLSILLSRQIPGFNSQRMMQDMDEWGYTFRLGSSRAWFEQDAEDAQGWLISHGIIDEKNQVTGSLRGNT